MTTETIGDIIKRIGRTMQKGGFEEALGEIRRFALDQSIQQAQGQSEQENYQAAREAITEAERYAFSDEEKSRVKKAKIPIYRKSIDEALDKAAIYMTNVPVTPEEVREAIEYCQRAQGYAMSIDKNITERIESIIGFRYEPERGSYTFRQHSITDESLTITNLIETVNQILEEMNTDFRVGPAYEDRDNGAFEWREVIPYALGLYQRKMKATDPDSKSWREAVDDDLTKIFGKGR